MCVPSVALSQFVPPLRPAAACDVKEQFSADQALHCCVPLQGDPNSSQTFHIHAKYVIFRGPALEMNISCKQFPAKWLRRACSLFRI